MKKRFLRAIALVLTICAMQCCFVPAVSAANNVTYDFYTPFKGYSHLYHWRYIPTLDEYDPDSEETKDKQLTPTSTLAKGLKSLGEDENGVRHFESIDDIAKGYNTNGWMLEYGSGYATPKAYGYLELRMAPDGYIIFKFKAPGTGTYNVSIQYATSSNTGWTTNSDGTVTATATGASRDSEITIFPAGTSQNGSDATALVGQYAPQAIIDCYNESGRTTKTQVIPYYFQEGEEYYLAIRGGYSISGHASGAITYLTSMTATYKSADRPAETVYARPTTILEEALTRWRDGFYISANVDTDGDGVKENYLALPIYGGKMYIFNLDTWQLIDEVHTDIDVPRGITVDDDGMIYLVGTGYSIYKYNLKTNSPSRSAEFNTNGVSLGSAYDIHVGDDGLLYFGTNNGHIIQYNPKTDTFYQIFGKDYGITNAGYVSSVVQQNVIEDGKEVGYLYAAVATTDKVVRHYLVKINSSTYEHVGNVEYTAKGAGSYMANMSITSDGIILGATEKLMAIDTKEMKLLTPEEYGSDIPVYGYVSEAIDGKHYYVGIVNKDVRNLYCYDPNASADKKVTVAISHWQALDCQGKTVMLDKDGNGETETYLLSVEQPETYGITLINVETGEVWDRADFTKLLPENAGAGTGVNSLTVDANGNLYYGGFTANQVVVYNPAEDKITNKLTTSGIQTDAIYIDNGTIYVGNYTEAQLTILHPNTNKPEVLMTLHNSLFKQSRIHSITGGDNKIFFGTFPYTYQHGGVLAWYDLTDNRSYVAVGPNPEDVYYANYADTKYNYTAAKPTVPVESVRWYKAEDGQEFTKFDVDGKQTVSFENWKGVVDYQGFTEVAYDDVNNILYAATSIEGGTNTSPKAGTSAKIIAYDVDNHKVIATFDPADQGFKNPDSKKGIPNISGIELDENGTLWCLVSETLFTLTLNGAKNGFIYTEKQSFSKYNYDGTQNRGNSTILFDGDYVYVAFERRGGLCRVKKDGSGYECLMPYVTTNTQVPESFVILKEDGKKNLYFLLGTALKMLALDPDNSEWAVANAVTAQIADITDATAYSTIEQIRNTYDQLTLRQKSLVQNYNSLVQAEADALIRDINALGNITWEKREEVQALMAVYRQMPASQQKMVTNYYVLGEANRALLQLEVDSPVVVKDASGNTAYYQTLEEALTMTAGTVTLRDNVTAGTVNLNANVVLDLNGNTLTATSISGTVIDSQNGDGLIKLENAQQAADLKTAENCLILWDNTTGESGYRMFAYTLVNRGIDANKKDAEVSDKSGTMVKSFWSEFAFKNHRAYSLIASAHSSLEIHFEVSFTTDDGETTSNTFAMDNKQVMDWAGETLVYDKNYCFFVQLTGFNNLKTAGMVEVKSIVKTAFYTAEIDVTPYYYEPKEPLKILEFEWDFGEMPAELNVQ